MTHKEDPSNRDENPNLPASENLQSEHNQRDGLFHVTLPGIKKDPLWIKYMEDASKKAVQLMERSSASTELITKNKRNLSILIRRLRKIHGDNSDDLLQAVQLQLQEFVSDPTLRDITDYVIADAHYNYSISDPLFRPTASGAQVISDYGTPRELAPTFETPFHGQYQVNPYQTYVERSRICKAKYSDADGYMRAPLAKLVLVPENGLVFEQANEGDEELPLTQTGNDYWWHTDVKYLDAIWNHINSLYTDLAELAKSGPSSDLIDSKTLLISQIGWWYFQAMPYTRGSGSIGNALLQSLFDFSGVKNSPYKEGVSPDLEALVTPLPKYAENFSSFLTSR